MPTNNSKARWNFLLFVQANWRIVMLLEYLRKDREGNVQGTVSLVAKCQRQKADAGRFCRTLISGEPEIKVLKSFLRFKKS